MIEPIIEQIINLLLKKENPVSSKQIASDLNVSKSTIKNNMSNVKEVVNSAKIELKALQGTGYWLEGTESQKKFLKKIILNNEDKSYSYNYRRHYILSILTEPKSNYTIQLFADDLLVSRNIISTDLVSIEDWLNNFDIKLIKTPNIGVKIEGNEFNIRQALIYSNTALMEKMVIDMELPSNLDIRISNTFYNYYSKVFPESDIYYFQNILLEAEKIMDYRYEDISFIQLLEYITLTFQRVKKHCIIQGENILSKCRFLNFHLEAASKLLNYIIDYSDTYETEVKSLASQFSLYGAYEDASYSLIKDEYYSYLARQFVDNLQEIIVNKKILINENLIEDISTLFIKKKMQKNFQVINSNFLKLDVKEQLPSLYGIVLANIYPFEKILGVKFTDNDIAYFVILIDNAFDDTSDILQVLLITTYDYNTAKYLQNKIKKSISNIQICEVIHPEELDKVDTSKYDVVLTTAIIDDLSALKISRRVDNYDLELIYRLCETKRNNKKKIIVKGETWFSEKLIINDLLVKKKEDVLKEGVNILVKNGYVTDKFYDVLVSQDSSVNTSIGNGVAIPHGYLTEIIKSGVALIKLKNPIEWTETEKVNLIFIIAISSKNKEEIQAFFANLYELLSDKRNVERIKNTDNKKEILTIIQEKNNIS